jgi:DNA-binding NarL/FixJ family response regulator
LVPVGKRVRGEESVARNPGRTSEGEMRLRAVAKLRAQGLSHRKMAERLGCCERTIRYDLAELKGRLPTRQAS